MEKIKLKDITEEQFAAARQIVADVIRWQSEPVVPGLVLPIVDKILRAGGRKTGLNAELNAGLRDGLYDGLNAGLDAGLFAGLYDGLNDGLDAGLRDDAPSAVELVYCGIFWSWWLARYLIAAQFGCPLDREKLSLLYGFCRACPIILNAGGRIVAVKPTKVLWRTEGTTPAPFSFPVYQLHGDGETAVECAGLKLYYHRNIKIPERMGVVKSSEWQPEWALTEENQEVRRLLLQTIPSEKFAAVLDLRVLDTWHSGVSQYELVEAGNNPYPSRYRALRFTCPSTERPYLVRVHPDVERAEDGVVMLNRGVHPASFAWEH